MKVSYGITVYNELEEIKLLLPFLIENKRDEDEIVVLFDSKNGTNDVERYLLSVNKSDNVRVSISSSFNNNFSEWKNNLNSLCTGDYIFQIDADEMISKYIVEILPTLLTNNSHIDLFYVPRANIIDGITDEHLKLWGWKVDEENNIINFPDLQGRIFRSNLKWEGIVHEKISGFKDWAILPPHIEAFSIIHHKTIDKQEEQNRFYSTL